ncbi:hypothetical protein [Priestia megaterium]|uniref:hypothetical protein n=1 Tax=Priestia megaterium TaxID=1404 RepID=UPI0021F4BFF1|nr:hypothetical protein [Priestia megaterium]UYP07262.1 hypothetical protein OIJ04_24505 [Priestia megaterium]
MNNYILDQIKNEEAKSLLIRATNYQAEILNTNLKNELIDRSTPVVWFGDPSPKNWVTIATNPSTREFLDGKDGLLLAGNARFYVREQGVSLEEYVENDILLNKTIEYYCSYFHRETAYRNWFGKPDGARLEGLLNGMGGSLYDIKDFSRVIHTDFFPIATRSQMGKIKTKQDILNSPFAKNFLRDVLKFLEPSLIIILGKEHCRRFEDWEQEVHFGTLESANEFPNAKYQIGFHSRLNIPVVGLHFKPSEQFIGLGGRTVGNGKSHGSYAKKISLNTIGQEIMNSLQKQFPNYLF